jgi:thymidine kinase
MAKLYFRYGAMGCGKTMQLLQAAFNYEERGHKVCVIKPKTDTKNGTKLLTRIGPERETDFCFDRDVDLFKEISKKYKDVQCILVDEAQFLTREQVDQCMQIVIELDIPVLCYGLRTDFQTNGFPGSTRLLEIAHTLDEIKTICKCGRKAIFNARYVDDKFVTEGDQVAIDNQSEVKYVSMCGKCYEEEYNKALEEKQEKGKVLKKSAFNIERR